MAITRSWEQVAAVKSAEKKKAAPVERRREAWFLLGATILVSYGLWLVYSGKTQSFAEFEGRTTRGELLNLNTVTSADKIAPFLLSYQEQGERDEAARELFAFLKKTRPIPNVGALSRVRIPGATADSKPRRIPVSRLKPTLVVRTPADFRKEFLTWCGIYLASFWVVHFAWRLRAFRGDAAILPAIHLLSGMGLILAVSLHDPLRDSLEFRKFAWGCACGCAILLLPLVRAFQYRHFARWVYTPLLGAFALFGLLLVIGSGPSGSDSKVNLGPFQPVELIKILLVFFLAGYFARRWEWLRELREKRFVPKWIRWPEVPRLDHVLPVMIGVAVALMLFFVLKDMGPALVTGFVFLAMFALARGRFGLAVLGIALLVCGVAVGYRLGAPKTVVDRVSMWLSPWDNDVRGGDQIAQSLWALSTGGAYGSGPGMGDPALIPAGHTDLVLPAMAEEWGFAGTVTVFVLFLLLVYRAFRIARHAPDEYSTFLAFGLGSLIALEMLLISGGALDAIPLSGVVSPFLSSGNTAMLANFLIFAVLLTISNQERPAARAIPTFVLPIRTAGYALAGLALILVARASYFQVLADKNFIIQDAKVYAEDKVKRPLHNPRLNSLMRQIPRGDIYDRNGALLATSSWDQLEKHRADYKALGIDIDAVCSRLDRRHYPFGPLTMQFLGDLRTGENFHATNASLMENDSNQHLQGYRDASELASAVRYRHYPNDPHMRALRDRDRDLRTSLDIRLQQRITEIMDRRTEAMHAGANEAKGAVVVMNVQTGDVLAMVNSPHPSTGKTPTADELLDRARYGRYPPGSTFKLVTAMAALRLDPENTKKTYACARLPDGRAGVMIPGWRRPIRDDVGDHPHGKLDMAQAIAVSCNAYFAQLGVFTVGTKALRETAEMLEIPPGDLKEFKQELPFSSYGQGPVTTTPFKMARVAATIANGGAMPEGRWVIDTNNSRIDAPRQIVPQPSSRFLATAMRAVVTSGTGRTAMAGLNVMVAGKTGTAQVEKGEPHSWFAGFAPYDEPVDRQVAFAVVVEHGGYGAKAAAPIAREVIQAARDLGIIGSGKVEPGKLESSKLGSGKR